VAKVFGDVAVVHTREDVGGQLVRRIVRDADTLVREGGRWIYASTDTLHD